MSTRTGDSSRVGAAAIAALVVLVPALAQAAPVEFFATVDRNEVAVGDTLTLSVTLSLDDQSAEPETLELPEGPDFEVVSRSSADQMSFAFGSGGPPTFKKVRTYTLLLTPLRAGALEIRSGKLILRGRQYQTGAIKVKALPTGSGPPRPRAQRSAPHPFGGGFPSQVPDPDDAEDDPWSLFFGGGGAPATDTDLFVRASVDKKQAYLGEQVTLSIYLFARVEVSGVEGFKMPKLDGFWAEDIESPSQITGERRVIDGVAYRAYLLKRRALFPIKSGTVVIDPIEVDIATGLSALFSGRKVHRKSVPVAIDVLPLPAGQPPDFESVNVGQWHLSSELSPTTVTPGQPVTLKVTLEGNGNLRNVAVPKVPELNGLKVFDPTTTEKINAVKGRFGGKRTFEYLLMAERTGSFDLPPIKLSYFDPAEGKYEVSSTQPSRFIVMPGQGSAAPAPSASAPAAPGNAGANVLSAGGLRPLRYKADLSPSRPPFFEHGFFFPLLAFPFAVWVLLAGVERARSSWGREDAGQKSRRASGRARRRLQRAQNLLAENRPSDFYAEISRVLTDYLSDKLGFPVGGLTRDELERRFSALGLDADASLQVREALDVCDAGRFAPGASDRAVMGRALDLAGLAMQAIEAARLSFLPEVGPR